MLLSFIFVPYFVNKKKKKKTPTLQIVFDKFKICIIFVYDNINEDHHMFKLNELNYALNSVLSYTLHVLVSMFPICSTTYTLQLITLTFL